MKCCFILPVYNHPHYLHDLVDYLQQFALPIILINDGSDVACTAILNALESKPNVTLLHHTENQGKGQAVMTGICYAKAHDFTHALQIDVDGQHHWADVQKFLDIAQAHPEAMIIGQPLFDETVPKSRLIGRYATHIWVWINALSLEIKDSMCGFRVYPVDATYQVITQHHLQPRMGFDSQILVHLSWAGVPCINVPTPVIYPENGISHFQLWRDNLSMTKTHSALFAGMLKRSPRLIYRNLKSVMTTKHSSS